MSKVTFAVCGMGNRGAVYAGQQLNFPEQMQVTAMADAKPERLEYANKYLHIPPERLIMSAPDSSRTLATYTLSSIVLPPSM